MGKTLGEGYAAMLFVASFDVLLYFGILILIDKSVDKVLSKEYEPLYFAFYMLGMLTIERLRNRTMCKNGAFERIKEEVENEPQKLKWSILSILYMIFGGSRNLVGIAIQLSDSEEEEFFVGYPMLISPEKFDFGIERFGCGI